MVRDNGQPWNTMINHELPWSTMNYHGHPWTTMVDHGISWTLAMFCWMASQILTMVTHHGLRLCDYGRPWSWDLVQSITLVPFNKTWSTTMTMVFNGYWPWISFGQCSIRPLIQQVPHNFVNGHMDGLVAGLTDRCVDRRTGGQMGGQTDRQTGQTDRHISIRHKWELQCSNQ